MTATPGMSLRDHGLPSALGRERLYLTLPATPVQFLPPNSCLHLSKGRSVYAAAPSLSIVPRSSIHSPETALSWPAMAVSRIQRLHLRLPSPRPSPADLFIHRHIQEAAGDPAEQREGQGGDDAHSTPPALAGLLCCQPPSDAMGAAAAPPTRPPVSHRGVPEDSTRPLFYSHRLTLTRLPGHRSCCPPTPRALWT